MANQYLVQIHDYIQSQLDLGQQARDRAQTRQDRARLKFCDGRIDELQQLRSYLSDHFDLDTQRYYD